MDQNDKIEIKEEPLRWHCVQHRNIHNCKDECYFQTILTLFGKKYTMSIIRLLLMHDKLRFNEILKNIGASPKTITERLKDLKNHGLITREVFNEIQILDEWGEYGNYCIGFLYEAKKKGYNIKEVPFIYKYRTAGETKTAPDEYKLLEWGRRYCLAILKLKFKNLYSLFSSILEDQLFLLQAI